MAIANIRTILCVSPATGVDIGVSDEFVALITSLPATILPSPFGSLVDTIKAVPPVVSAIDAAQDSPDDLYIVAGTEGKLANAIWPASGTIPMRKDDTAAPNLRFAFNISQNIALFDHDTVSADDHLGSITMYETEAGTGEIAKLASSTVEGSAYYVTYTVDPS